MRSYILVGDNKFCSSYIEEYIHSQNIKSYNITKIEKTKIGDVRSLHKILAIKFNEKHVIILNELTDDSQNALLKTLEELPEFVDVFIKAPSLESLLPTIISRSHVIYGTNSIKIDQAFTDDISSMLHLIILRKDIASVFSFIERIGFETVESIDNFIKLLRFELRNCIRKNDSKETITNLVMLLAKLQEHYPLMKQNNLNKRLTIENILLSN